MMKKYFFTIMTDSRDFITIVFDMEEHFDYFKMWANRRRIVVNCQEKISVRKILCSEETI